MRLVAKKLANGFLPNHFEVEIGPIEPKEKAKKSRREELFVSPEIELDWPRGRKRHANAVFSPLLIRLPKRRGQQLTLCRRQLLLMDKGRNESYFSSYRTSGKIRSISMLLILVPFRRKIPLSLPCDSEES